jgi:hypothetical protein
MIRRNLEGSHKTILTNNTLLEALYNKRSLLMIIKLLNNKINA